MTDLEKAIRNALFEIEQTEATMKQAGLEPDMKPLLACIDSISARLPADTDPVLLELLRQKNYGAARRHLSEMGRKSRKSAMP